MSESLPERETQVGDWWIGDDFIGVFETKYDTSKMIQYWHDQYEANATFSRLGFPSKREPIGDGRARKDEVVNWHLVSIECSKALMDYQRDYNMVVGECVDLYTQYFSSISNMPMVQLKINIQRTQPMGGYHSWHCENNGPAYVRDRILASMMYLNTIPPEGGGETEFLYQRRRINPVAGRVVIWPAGFTHTHRGNPPLQEDKFIATSWIEQQHNPMDA